MKEYVVTFRSSYQISPDEFNVYNPSMKVTETTTVKEIDEFYRKHTDTEFYTLLHQSITRLMQGQKLPIYNVSSQLCDCKDFTIKGKMLVCKECGKEHKSLSA